MSDRIREPDSSALLGRPEADPIDSVAQLAARNELQDFALQARTGIVAAGAVARPAPSSLSGNLIVDADFEGSTLNAGWSPVGAGALSISSAQAHAGTQSMLYTGSAPGGAYYGWDPVNNLATLPCTAGDAVYFEAWFMQGGTGPATVGLAFDFYSDDVGTLISTSTDEPDQFVTADGWQFLVRAWPVPVGAVRFRAHISCSFGGNPSTFFIDSALLALINSFQGPLVTTPGDVGARLKLEGNELHGFSGHHLESLEGALTFGISPSGNVGATKDRGLTVVRSPSLSGGIGGAAAQLELIGGAPDNSAVPLFKVDQAMEVLGQVLVDSGGVDVTGTAILRGALSLIGGLNASSYVLDIYQPADVNPLLTGVATGNCGAQHTAFTITDRKMAILSLHFVCCATVNNTATSLQHVQAGLLTNTAGSTPATAATFSIPGTAVGTSADRMLCVAGYVNAGVVCSGAFNVLPQLGWTTTVTVGAGGVANLRTFSSTTITLAMAVA